jgi:branched-subunit amino acid aminotransferase/4-amino-4-deoxychorismate lyase
MGFYASVNGQITPAEEARVSVLDNGFTFGDGVYETLRTYGGRPFHLDRHLERLGRSAARRTPSPCRMERRSRATSTPCSRAPPIQNRTSGSS